MPLPKPTPAGPNYSKNCWKSVTKITSRTMCKAFCSREIRCQFGASSPYYTPYYEKCWKAAA
jgi:hypothetical protein